MKTLKVEDIYTAGYETFADVAERLPKDLQRQTAALSHWLQIASRIRNSTRPAGGLV